MPESTRRTRAPPAAAPTTQQRLADIGDDRTALTDKLVARSERRRSTKTGRAKLTVTLEGCGPLGIGLGLDADNVVTVVKPETPAQAAGLVLGDRVLSVDGTAGSTPV